MRTQSAFISSEELDEWLVEAGVRVEPPARARLRARLDAVRDRVRAATPQARSVQVHAYLGEFDRSAALVERSADARALHAIASSARRWDFPWKGVAAWAALALLTAAAARVDRDNAFTLLVSLPTWYGLPVLAGAAHAALECGRSRVRSGRAIALLGSVAAWCIAWGFLYLVLDARGCRNPGDASGIAALGAIGVGMAGLAGIAGAERGNRDRWVVASGVVLAAPFWILYALFALMHCAFSR
jgi:hypothetical protein